MWMNSESSNWKIPKAPETLRAQRATKISMIKMPPSDSVIFKITKRNCGWQIKKGLFAQRNRGKTSLSSRIAWDFPGSWTPFPQNAGCRSNELKHGNLFLTLWILWSFVSFFANYFYLNVTVFSVAVSCKRGFLLKNIPHTFWMTNKKRVGNLLNRNLTNSEYLKQNKIQKFDLSNRSKNLSTPTEVAMVETQRWCLRLGNA